MSIAIYHKAISEEECDSIISFCKPRAILLNDPSYSVYYRYDFVDKTNKFGNIQCLRNYILGNRWFFTSYETGGFINIHQDGHSSVCNIESQYTVLIYLNNDYEGGELVIPVMGMNIKPSKGTIIIMDQETYHYVNAVLKGTKNILRVDAIARIQR